MSDNNENNSPLFGMFTGMMSQFFREAVASGNLSAVIPGYQDSSTPPTPSQPRLPTLAVPPAQPYTSTRSLALPAAPTGHPLPSNIPSSLATTQPMLGISGLGISLAGHSNNSRHPRVRDLTTSQISHTNAGRVAAANAHLGHQTRGRRRGPAVRGASLHHGPQTTLEKVSSLDPAGVRQIQVTHVIQPYQPQREVVYYKNLKSAHVAYLQNSELCFDYTLSEDTPVSSILQMSAENMRMGPRHYVFGPTPAGPSTRLQHETLDLQPLVFVNSAKNRGNGAAHLRRESIGAGLLLRELFEPTYKLLFALPTHCVENNRFILHSIVRNAGITFVESLPGALPRTHTCLTLRQSKQFGEAFEMDWLGDESEHSDTSGGVPAESDMEDDDEDENMPQAPPLTAATPPVRRPLPSRAPLSSNSTSTSAVTPLLPASDLRTPPILAPATTIPAWPTTSFMPEAGGLYRDLFSRHDVTAAIYQAATDGGLIEVDGGSIDECALSYVGLVQACARKGDYTPMLRHRRRFRILRPNGDLASLGSGVESEVIWAALNLFLRHPERFCVVTDEDRLSLAISMPLRLASTIPPSRLEDMQVFGALVALALISGKGPGSLSPGLIQYCLNNRLLESLTPSFVGSWNPSLDRAARQLQAVGAQGDLTPHRSLIAAHVGVQIGAFENRSPNQHNALVHQVVHSGILGPDLVGHPEGEHFTMGLELPCANGFSFGKLARSYPGGTEFYIAHTWTAYISDFASLEPHLAVSVPSAANLGPHFGTTANALDPEELFYGFLRRSGNPCTAAAFEDAKPHFHPDVIARLSEVDSVSFRPRMFCWASTGSPFIEPDAAQTEPIQVDFVLPNDAHYAEDMSVNSSLMRQGTISFRSCSRITRIPMSKLVELYQTHPDPEAPSFEEAVECWLFLEVLNGVGKVSML
ncbi:hypothetical protein DFH06DRAFT_1438745 [Mycena polygramma]|nr:hypothetical protein DFH06DRAFT_1438745 [Mycena polygramma]